jgi:hypothetical protein
MNKVWVVTRTIYDDLTILGAFASQEIADQVSLENEDTDVQELEIYHKVVRPRPFYSARIHASRNYFKKDGPRLLSDSPVNVSMTFSDDQVWPWSSTADWVEEKIFHAIHAPESLEGSFNLNVTRGCGFHDKEKALAKSKEFEEEIRALPESFWQDLFDQALLIFPERVKRKKKIEMAILRDRHTRIVLPTGSFMSTSEAWGTELTCPKECPCRENYE